MPAFSYQAKDRGGKVLKGQIEAASTREAATKLRDEGLFIINLQSVSSFSGTVKTRQGKGGKVKLKDLLVFTRQFSVMIKAGVNLLNCLNLLAKQTENENFAQVINDIRRSVEGGETLHSALSVYPKIFPPIYIYMIEAGEAGGQLEVVLQRICEHLEREFELKKKIVGAMTYPAVILTVAIGVVIILMTFVVPQFVPLFRDAGVELPITTKILIGTSDFLTKYWYIAITGFLGIVFLGGYYRSTPQGREFCDRILYRMKIFGPVIQKLASARFSRTLATLLDSGVMITNSLELVERAVGNTVVAIAISKARQNITKGSGLAGPLEETGVFPPMVTQMIAVGEETGELSTLLNQVADFYEKEAGYAIQSLTSLVEPAIIVLLGGVVAIVVSAIMIPMFELSSGATMK